MDTIGFIGVGIMGKPMARNLMKAGYPLVVHDIDAAPVQELTGEGARAADSPAAVAASCRCIITMLPDGPDVEQVCLGENGILSGITAGSLLVDMSSIAPGVTKKVGAALAEKGCRMLDAPVSGGEPGAIAGTLAIMVGGTEDDFNEARPVLERMGKSVTLVGELGAGQTTKLVNQILVGIHIAAMGEAFCLAAKAGIDPQRVFDAIRGGLAGSNVLNAKVPLMLARNFKPGFRIRLHQKDLQNALIAGKELGLCLPLTGTVQQYVARLVGMGKGDDDHGGLVQVLEELNGMTIQA
jgi:2-hydroxy-3-oxopropionate reductase